VTVAGTQASGDFLTLDANPSTTITNSTGTNATPAVTCSTPCNTFGYTTNDSTLSGTANRFTVTDDLFAGLITTAGQVAYNGAAIANDNVNVGYRLKFNGAQSAGAYHGTLVYTCTPVF
jgi:hypothetical protein